MKVGIVYHTGFTVSDIERSIVFYRDVLGLKLVKRQTGTAPYLATVTGFEGVHLETALLQPAEGGSMLELLQYVSHPGQATDRATNRLAGLRQHRLHDRAHAQIGRASCREREHVARQHEIEA